MTRSSQTGVYGLALAIGCFCLLAAQPVAARRFTDEPGLTPGARIGAGIGHYNLRATRDAGMQRQLELRLQQIQLAPAVGQKRLAVALVDITEPARPRLAMVNGDDMLYAASLPKIAILLAAFQRAQEGKLALDAHMRAQLTAMIRHSSNAAASYVLGRVGQSYLARVLQSGRYKLYDKHLNGGLWVGRAYGQGGLPQRDPLHNLSHGATVYQVARFYYLLQTGHLVSPEYSRQMKEIMGDPGIRHKFVAGLLEAHPDARIYRKSGSWRTFHSDSAIVERADRRYIAVALADDPNGEQWMRRLIVALDEIVFSRPLRAGAPWCLTRIVCTIPYRYSDRQAPWAAGIVERPGA